MLIDPNFPVVAVVTKRSEHETSFVNVFADPKFVGFTGYLAAEMRTSGLALPLEPAKFVTAACYSAAALEENDEERSTDCDWEIVCLICSPVEKEPMHPLAMARNALEKAGGTMSKYTAQEFAEAIWYWSQRVKVKGW